MPRRTTLTYSSEDAPDIRSEQIYVYYCKCGPVPVASALLYNYTVLALACDTRGSPAPAGLRPLYDSSGVCTSVCFSVTLL